MAAEVKSVGVLVGSLRQNSLTKRLATASIKLAPASLRFQHIEIGNLPFYNEDLEASPPAEWRHFREQIAAQDAILFFSPEYNRSIPGCLKNAIDVASRPSRAGAINRKPAGIVTQSPGALGGFGANHALRQCLTFLDMPVVQQPECYINFTAQMFGDDGSITNDGARDLLTRFLVEFDHLVQFRLDGR